jgi:hypothetical protein
LKRCHKYLITGRDCLAGSLLTKATFANQTPPSHRSFLEQRGRFFRNLQGFGAPQRLRRRLRFSFVIYGYVHPRPKISSGDFPPGRLARRSFSLGERK